MSTATMPARADRMRDAYEDHMFTLWTAAEQATEGYMVNEIAAARGIRGADLYLPGKGRAPESCASNELRSAWDLGLAPRPVSFATFSTADRGPERPRKVGSMPQVLVDMRGLAQQLGVKYQSIRAYRGRPGALPDPDFIVGGSPAWTQETVDAFLANRRVTSW